MLVVAGTSGSDGARDSGTSEEVLVWLAYAIPMGLYVAWPQAQTGRTAPSEVAPEGATNAPAH